MLSGANTEHVRGTCEFPPFTRKFQEVIDSKRERVKKINARVAVLLQLSGSFMPGPAGEFGLRFRGMLLYTVGVLFHVEWCTRKPALIFFYHTL